MTDRPKVPVPPATGQSSIATSPLTRTAMLVGTGARVGLNYLKYYGKRSLGNDQRGALDLANANEVYDTFSRLKGGPLKVAQMLSIDQNLLPGAYSVKFAQAHYSAPPLSYPLVARTFRRELGQEPTEIFDTFAREAAHGASIGQVHRATLKGHTYAVKVQYPGVAQSLKSDLAVVKPLALQLMRLKEDEIAPYLKEVEERMLEETDYTLELTRSVELSHACAHLHHVGFPRYYPELSCNRILTMDWIEGLTLDKFADQNPDQGLRDLIGQALWDFYHYQIHQLRLFHADPHPGNFKVHGDTLYVLDFGCTKRLQDDFYYKNFRLMDPRLLEDPITLEKALDDLGVLLPMDTTEHRKQFLSLCTPSIELLARPFRNDFFDFGDQEFMTAIYKMGENNSQDNFLRNMRGTRGSAHSIYVNRAYFGLYSLLTRLRARIHATLPDWLISDDKP